MLARVTGMNDGTLANEDIVAILEPLGRNEDHFPLFNRRGLRIGVVLAHRSRRNPYRVHDRSLRVIDMTGLAYTLGWSQRATARGESFTAATVRDSRADEIVGHVTTQDGGEVHDPSNRLLARHPDFPRTKIGPLRLYLVDSEDSALANALDARYSTKRRTQPGGYRRGMMIQFAPQCDAGFRVLAVALRLCELFESMYTPPMPDGD